MKKDIKILTLQEHINTVGIRFMTQYQKVPTKFEIGRTISKLPDPKDKETIDKLIGNDSWTKLICEVCGQKVNKLILLRPSYYNEYENSGIEICADCLNEAKEMSDAKN